MGELLELENPGQASHDMACTEREKKFILPTQKKSDTIYLFP